MDVFDTTYSYLCTMYDSLSSMDLIVRALQLHTMSAQSYETRCKNLDRLLETTYAEEERIKLAQDLLNKASPWYMQDNDALQHARESLETLIGQMQSQYNFMYHMGDAVKNAIQYGNSKLYRMYMNH